MEESFENFEVEQRKRIVKTFKIISIVICVIQIALIVLHFFNIWLSQKQLLLILVLLPWIKYIYALRFSDITYWDEANKKSGVYYNAEHADLVLHREENPLGIEYWHVCVRK